MTRRPLKTFNNETLVSGYTQLVVQVKLDLRRGIYLNKNHTKSQIVVTWGSEKAGIKFSPTPSVYEKQKIVHRCFITLKALKG